VIDAPRASADTSSRPFHRPRAATSHGVFGTDDSGIDDVAHRNASVPSSSA
jgi:hypothetical protein